MQNPMEPLTGPGIPCRRLWWDKDGTGRQTTIQLHADPQHGPRGVPMMPGAQP